MIHPAQLQRVRLARILKFCMLQVAWSYNTFQRAKNKGSEQSAQMGRLVCTFVVRMSEQNQIFSRSISLGSFACNKVGFSHFKVHIFREFHLQQFSQIFSHRVPYHRGVSAKRQKISMRQQ